MSSYEEEIGELRKEIDRLNAEIVGMLSERVAVATRIGEVKKRHRVPIVDESREDEVYHQIRELASEYGIDPKGLERAFREIVRLCADAELEDGA